MKYGMFPGNYYMLLHVLANDKMFFLFGGEIMQIPSPKVTSVTADSREMFANSVCFKNLDFTEACLDFRLRLFLLRLCSSVDDSAINAIAAESVVGSVTGVLPSCNA